MSKIEEIKAKLESHRNDLSVLTAEERNILSADGVAKLRGPLEAAAAKVKATNRRALEADKTPEELNAECGKLGYLALAHYVTESGLEDEGIESQLTHLLTDLMHMGYDVNMGADGDSDLFEQAYQAALGHFLDELTEVTPIPA